MKSLTKDRTRLGLRLRSARAMLNFNQSEVVEKTGLHGYGGYEVRQVPREDMLPILSGVLQIPLEELKELRLEVLQERAAKRPPKTKRKSPLMQKTPQEMLAGIWLTLEKLCKRLSAVEELLSKQPETPVGDNGSQPLEQQSLGFPSIR